MFDAWWSIVSTRVEVNRPAPPCRVWRAHCLHARGGEPKTYSIDAATALIVSTRVEVNRNASGKRPHWPHCLHARGGEPSAHEIKHLHRRLSPRAWR